MIIWIGSYPKSGNTYIRSFLSAYYFSEDGKFNFDLLKDIENNKYFLAGKIDINNVERALKYTDKIDVNSGLETEKGIKDQKKIKDFFTKVRSNEN